MCKKTEATLQGIKPKEIKTVSRTPIKNIKTLAIVDDDAIFVFLTKMAIEQTHLVDQSKVFGNGLDAINYLKENRDNDDMLPEVILLDLSMPVMDGWQFLDEYVLLKPKIRKSTAIDIVTSSISPEDVSKAKSNSAVSDFIVKPITKEKFKEIVEKL